MLKLADYKIPCIVMTFNGSASIHNDGMGYDMPFIIKRSELRLTVQS